MHMREQVYILDGLFQYFALLNLVANILLTYTSQNLEDCIVHTISISDSAVSSFLKALATLTLSMLQGKSSRETPNLSNADLLHWAWEYC